MLQNDTNNLSQLKELFLNLRKNSDYKNVWFHLINKDGTSFYRSWINKSGDSILKARVDVVKMLQNPIVMSTISVGKFDMSFKSMVPIYNKEKNLLGIIEILTHFNSIAKKITQKEMQPIFLVDKKYKKQLSNPFTKLFINDYYVSNLNAQPKYMQILKEKGIETILNSDKTYFIDSEKDILFTFYKLSNINGQKMAYFFLFKKLENINMYGIEILKKKRLLYILIIIVLLSSILHYLNNRKFIAEISAKNIKMEKLNRELSNSIKQQKEIQHQKDKQQDILFQQSKMASMGEMIGNIAHQWRQPIAVISMWANNIIVDLDMDEVDNENLRKYANNINIQTKHLSQTIDDFRNFFSPNKEKTTFTIQDSLDKTMNLLTASFKIHNIEVIQDIEDIKFTAPENELTQAFLNIINNAKDALLLKKDLKKRVIFIKVYKKNSFIFIEILDNAGGIKEKILNKIFEPYFTTKHKSQGTGIGLYMTESIVSKHLYGEIYAVNKSYNYEGIDYKGANFIIKLPLDDVKNKEVNY